MTEAKPPRKAARVKRTKIKAEHKVGEKEQLNRHWRSLFLDALAETSNVTASAKGAGVTTSRAYKVRRCEPGFADAWRQALLEGYEHLEMETLYRLRFGIGKEDNRFDVANALRLLAIHRETIVQERAKRSDGDEESVLARLNAKIDAMRAREAEAARMLAEEGVAVMHSDGRD